jgi:hypothetical protein
LAPPLISATFPSSRPMAPSYFRPYSSATLS